MSRPALRRAIPTLLVACAIALAGLPLAVPRADAVGWRAPGDEVPNDTEWFGGDEDFLVATIVSVDDAHSTNQHPPRVTVRVNDRLRSRIPRGELIVEWEPVPLYMPCPVGEEANIRAWENAHLRGPAVGQRMVLGGVLGPDRVWRCDPDLRWIDGRPEAMDARRKIAEWTPRVLGRQAAEGPVREAAARKERAAREHADALLVAAERQRLDDERAIRAGADLEALVRASDAILLSPPPIPSAAHGSRWGAFAVVHPSAWLLRPRGAHIPSDSLAALVFGQREDTLRVRWLATPRDDAPGPAHGQPVTCIAFLRYAQDVVSEMAPDPFLRPVDPFTGILWADQATVERVRHLVATRASAPTEPPRSCGAAFAEFAVHDTAEAAQVALKLSRTDVVATQVVRQSAILACTPGPEAFFAAMDVGWFVPCAFPDAQYRQDFRSGAAACLVRPAQMKALLDSLATLPALREGRVDPADSLTLMLRRTVDGQERLFEATLDGPTRHAVCRMMGHMFRGTNALEPNLTAFWSGLDRSFVDDWSGPRPRLVRPRVFAPGRRIAATATGGAIVGWVRDAVTGAPLPNSLLRITTARRVDRTDDDGAFALPDLAPGMYWCEVLSDHYVRGFTRLTARAGEVDTVVVKLAYDGVRPAPPAPPPIARGPWRPRPTGVRAAGARVLVRVRDAKGAPLPGAHVLVLEAGMRYGGTATAGGALLFPLVPPGPKSVLVRAADHEPWARTIDFGGSTPETLDVRLEPRRRG